MSDFFNDDFTAELKKYFLESLTQEADKFSDLIDDKLWKRISGELNDCIAAWIVDAKTNEFVFFSQWLEMAPEHLRQMESPEELRFLLGSLKSYVQDLLQGKIDGEELQKSHVLHKLSQKTHLFLHCQVGNQDFAIPVLSVVEITSKLQLFRLPVTEPQVLGVVAYRGEPLPVLNLNEIGFQERTEAVAESVYVICEWNKIRFVLNVSRAEDFINLTAQEQQDLHEAWTQKNSCVSKIFNKNEKNIVLLDMDRLVAA